MLLTPNPTNSCFGCGAANPRSMMLTFEQDDETRSIRGAFKLDAEYQGGGGFIHGGIIALVDKVADHGPDNDRSVGRHPVHGVDRDAERLRLGRARGAKRH